MAAGGPEVGRELAGPNPLAGRAQTAAAQESMSVADRLPGRCAPVIGERRVLPQRRRVGRVTPCAPTDGRAQRRARSDAPYLLWLAASAVADPVQRRKVFAWRSRSVSIGWGHANKAVGENPSPARLLGTFVGFALRLLLAGSMFSPRSAGLEYQSGFVDVHRGIWCGLCH